MVNKVTKLVRLYSYRKKSWRFANVSKVINLKLAECITDEATKKIHDYVEKVKVAPEVKETYMKFEEIMAYREEVGFARGEQTGMAKGELTAKRQAILDVLEIYGAVSEDLCNKIEQEKDVQILGKWLKLAAQSGSIPEFMENIKHE